MVNVKVCDFTETIKYLGVHIGVKRLAKLKFNNDNIEKIMQMIKRVTAGSLKINQILNALRTFILPRLYHCMMNSIFSKVIMHK